MGALITLQKKFYIVVILFAVFFPSKWKQCILIRTIKAFKNAHKIYNVWGVFF